jgi:hypothetical protein
MMVLLQRRNAVRIAKFSIPLSGDGYKAALGKFAVW